MNAFLIFCKKHRPIVREKYPNLENRAITKILGDWWANLEKKDQEPFKSLASNYKDAFLSANPTFKWYKLPAPPLRTLSTRPTNSDRSYGDISNGLAASPVPKSASYPVAKHQPHHHSHSYEERHQEADHAEADLEEYPSPPVVQVSHRRRMGNKNNMQLFKLADENQMGGLSNLMMGNGPPMTTTRLVNDNNNNTTEDEDLIIDESGELGTIVAPFANMRTHAARMEVTPKRKLTAVHSEFQAMKRAKKRADCIESAFNAATTTTTIVKGQGHGQEPTTTQQKSSRACKGKKYLEFIKQTKTSPTGVKEREREITPTQHQQQMVNGPKSPSHSLSVIKRAPQQMVMVQPVGFPHNGYCKPQPMEDEDIIGNDQQIKEEREREEDEEEDLEDVNEGMVEERANISIRSAPLKKRAVVVVQEEDTEKVEDVVFVKLETEKVEANNGKLFDASDFELDSKIIALPALSLDTYLTRKRETKKKKKIGGNGKSSAAKKQVANTSSSSCNSGPTIHEVKEAMQKSVGSQKRKARKESITRRDVNSVSAVAAAVVRAEELAGGGGGGEDEVSGNTSDLLILATLAAGEIETHQK